MMEEQISEIILTKSLALNWEKTGAIIGISGKYIGTIFRIKPRKKIYIGRDYHFADFVLEDTSVSRKHCWIEYDDKEEKYRFFDCSKNGVILNGEKNAERSKIILLSVGDEIRIANTKHIFKLG